MIKLLGMVTFLFSSIVMGFLMAKDLKERINVLNDIYNAATYIKTDLEYRAADIGSCFTMRGKLFNDAYKYITVDNMIPCTALKKALEEIGYISKEDKDIIRIYADNLNAENVEGQIANIQWLIENIRGKIREAENEYRLKGKLYKSSGAIVALGCIILIL